MDEQTKHTKIANLTGEQAQEIVTRGVFFGSLAVALLTFGLAAAYAAFQAT